MLLTNHSMSMTIIIEEDETSGNRNDVFTSVRQVAPIDQR